MFWGLSEALDLLGEYLKSIDNQNEIASKEFEKQKSSKESTKIPQCQKEINILLFGSNDPRHLIKTMSKLYTHRSQGMTPTLNFYFVDGCTEMVARNMLLIAIALESSEILNLWTKVHLFMDIYGNSLIRTTSYHYLMDKAKVLLKIITDDDYLKKISPMICIDLMKYRDRDGLKNAFNFWLAKEGNIFKIQEYWENRLRKFMGSRYDYREGQFDWDLNMILKERECKQLCSQEYHYWRETGIAFTFPEYEYNKPNKTMAIGLVRNGNKYYHRGYVGDIQTGPFAAYGLKTSDERMHKNIHGENDFRSTDITERNLLEFFHELMTQTNYRHDASMIRKYGAVRFQMSKRLTFDEFDFEQKHNYDKPWNYIEGIKIHILSCDDIYTLQQIIDGQWKSFFDIVFVGHNYFSILHDNFIHILNSQALLILETKLLSVARKEDINIFEKKLFNYAKRTNLKPVINYNTINSKYSILKFKRE